MDFRKIIRFLVKKWTKYRKKGNFFLKIQKITFLCLTNQRAPSTTADQSNRVFIFWVQNQTQKSIFDIFFQKNIEHLT